MEPINLADYRAAAREKLPRMAYDYYDSGAHDEITRRENHAAYDRLRLRYRVLRDVSRRELATTVLGQAVSMPVLAAPTAFHGMADPEGEVATARAAAAAETVFITSTLANRSVEDVAAAAPGRTWFQLYVFRDREVTRDLVARAAAAGCGALVVTVDVPYLGVRERDVRNGFHLPDGLEMGNLVPYLKGRLPADAGASGLATYIASMFDPSLDWQALDWLAGLSELPVVVKGIVHPDDARLAVDSGAAGIVVSNHGGRQLDTAPATIDVLAEIADAVDGKLEILVDGGVRRGTDVVKALALGARAVAIGRPLIWGLAVDGTAGARRVLELLRAETSLAMALCGVTDPAEISCDLLAG